MKEINLQQILFNTAKGSHAILTSNEIVIVKIAMLEAIKQALELAAENVQILRFTDSWGDPASAIDKQSILDTINQVKP